MNKTAGSLGGNRQAIKTRGRVSRKGKKRVLSGCYGERKDVDGKMRRQRQQENVTSRRVNRLCNGPEAQESNNHWQRHRDRNEQGKA